MRREIFREEELPMAELEKIGLARNGELLMSDENRLALLFGRRTNLIRLQNLEDKNVKIGELEAKISVERNPKGKLELRAHPIYHQAVFPVDLTDAEAEMLEQGQIPGVYKKLKDEDKKEREYLFEYDTETREYVKTDTGKIEEPLLVNNEILSDQQRESFRKGKEVQLSDGATFRYTGIDTSPFRANRIALAVSLLLDGGLSYVIYQGIKSLTGKSQPAEAEVLGAGFQKSVDNLKKAIEYLEFRIKEQSANDQNKLDLGLRNNRSLRNR
ncbi:DUF4099 domain-containing protein [Pedobacter foliorum]|uniref:DUF4099 domain-containing protein n=1 Tax=Pedobacter foliorum TaxID=2739058 RepID=UPI001563C30A|nr:DUF4099 domain-containing protein [Pedobacter foliorum]NRF37535.1 DUF4099 domain-containing protein [Pedobacter foliorum]